MKFTAVLIIASAIGATCQSTNTSATGSVVKTTSGVTSGSGHATSSVAKATSTAQKSGSHTTSSKAAKSTSSKAAKSTSSKAAADNLIPGAGLAVAMALGALAA